MSEIALLPADIYKVVNKTILTDFDRKVLVAFYEPIIGPFASSLYLTLWHDLEQLELYSRDLNHHHLMKILKSSMNNLKVAREILESMGLLKTYLKEGDLNSYIYELYSPLSPYEFFNHPILNIVLYNNIGREEYERLKLFYQKIKINTKEYKDITKQLDDVYKSDSYQASDDIRERTITNITVSNKIDYDLLIANIPKSLINDKTFNKRSKDLINLLAFIYDIDTIKMSEIVRSVLNEFGMIDKNELRIATRKFYQFNNNSLPTLVYRSQPDFLKSPDGDNSMRGKIINLFENTTPYDFLKSKNRGVKPTAKDLKILEMLMVDMELSPAVVNVLIDYVLRKNNNKFISAYVEAVAAQWNRAGVKTAKEAMEFAEKEHKKMSNKVIKKTVKTEVKPPWFNENIGKDEITKEQEEELKDLLKEFS